MQQQQGCVAIFIHPLRAAGRARKGCASAGGEYALLMLPACNSALFSLSRGEETGVLPPSEPTQCPNLMRHMSLTAAPATQP